MYDEDAMRKDLFITFLGLWIVVVPLLPISPGSTQTAIVMGSGLLVAVLAFWSFAKSHLS